MSPSKTSFSVLFLDKKSVFLGIVLLGTVLAIGVLIGYYGKGDNQNNDTPKKSLIQDYVTDQFKKNHDMVHKVIKEVDSTRLRNYHKELTKAPHIAGLKRDQELTGWIKEEWEKEGLDRVELAEYDFFLSWPNSSTPNFIRLLDENGNERFKSHYKETELRKGDDHPNFVHAFNAYAPAGTITGQLVYVNYGRVEDLTELEKITGSETFLEGKICIARYGKIFRGNKVHNCQTKGAIGVIIFSDPADVAVEGTDSENVYPNTIFLPGTGVQRGSVYIGDGDPLSPHWASIPNAYRVEPDDVDGLPKIPSQPIGYDDARELLKKMGGLDSPESWKGGMDDIKYKIGGVMKGGYEGWSVKLEVHNYRGTIKSSNVIGYITGGVEPDRYVMLGNHRDAWGYGAVDPSSGTAQLMEVVRSFGKMLKTGWRPRRTIIFASWAAEESGLEGSYEWVFEHLTKLMSRTVALINTDICVSGPIVKPRASPVLRDVVMASLKHASDPNPGRDRSYYEYWVEWTNQDIKEGDEKKVPEIKHLGSGTDHAAFAFYAGIPAFDIDFAVDTKKHKGVGSYPMYHTGYETFYLMDTIIDPGYKIHRSCAQTTLYALLSLGDSAIIPYNLTYFPYEMKKTLDSFDENNTTKTLQDNGVDLIHLKNAIDEFEVETIKFMNSLKTQSAELEANPFKLKMINDQMMQLERVFLMDGGLPERQETRHAVFAPSKFNKYSGNGFPAISDLLYEFEKLEFGSPGHKKRVNLLKRHVSDLMIMTKAAIRFLKPLDQI